MHCTDHKTISNNTYPNTAPIPWFGSPTTGRSHTQILSSPTANPNLIFLRRRRHPSDRRSSKPPPLPSLSFSPFPPPPPLFLLPSPCPRRRSPSPLLPSPRLPLEGGVGTVEKRLSAGVGGDRWGRGWRWRRCAVEEVTAGTGAVAVARGTGGGSPAAAPA